MAAAASVGPRHPELSYYMLAAWYLERDQDQKSVIGTKLGWILSTPRTLPKLGYQLKIFKRVYLKLRKSQSSID